MKYSISLLFVLSLWQNANAATQSLNPLRGVTFADNALLLNKNRVLFISEKSLSTVNIDTGKLENRRDMPSKLSDLGCTDSSSLEYSTLSGGKIYLGGKDALCELDLETLDVVEIKYPNKDYSPSAILTTTTDGRIVAVSSSSWGSMYVFSPKDKSFSSLVNTRIDVLGREQIRFGGNGDIYIADDKKLAIVNLSSQNPQLCKLLDTNLPNAPFNTMEMLQDGNILFLGQDQHYLYDPKSEKIVQTFEHTMGRGGISLLLNDGRVLFGGACVFGVAPCRPSGDVFIYEPISRTIEKIHRPAWITIWQNLIPMPNGEIVINGYHPYLDHKNVEVFSPTTKRFTAIGTMAHWRQKPESAMLSSGKILTWEGESQEDRPLETWWMAEIYDPSTNRSIGIKVLDEKGNEITEETAENYQFGNGILHLGNDHAILGFSGTNGKHLFFYEPKKNVIQAEPQKHLTDEDARLLGSIVKGKGNDAYLIRTYNSKDADVLVLQDKQLKVLGNLPHYYSRVNAAAFRYLSNNQLLFLEEATSSGVDDMHWFLMDANSGKLEKSGSIDLYVPGTIYTPNILDICPERMPMNFYGVGSPETDRAVFEWDIESPVKPVGQFPFSRDSNAKILGCDASGNAFSVYKENDLAHYSLWQPSTGLLQKLYSEPSVNADLFPAARTEQEIYWLEIFKSSRPETTNDIWKTTY